MVKKVPCAQGSLHNKELSWLIKTVNKIRLFVSIFCAAGLNGIMSVYICYGLFNNVISHSD